MGGTDVHLHVLLEVLDLQAFTVEKDFDVFDRPGHVINALSQETRRILVYGIHPKPLEIRFECDAGIFLALRLLRVLCLSANPCYWSKFACTSVGIREFRAVAVATAGKFFLIVIVVGGGKENARTSSPWSGFRPYLGRLSMRGSQL